MKKVMVRFLKDHTYKTVDKGGKPINKTYKKGWECELLECVVIRLTANPDNVLVERI